MSAQANIVAFDGAATPVSHTLEPMNSSKDPVTGEIVAMWSERLTTLPDYAQIRYKTTQKKNKDGVWRLFTQIEVPVMEAVAGQNAAGYTAAPKVAYIDKVQIVSYHSERSTIVNRRLARQLAVNIHGGISTIVAPVTTGPAAELVDKLVTAS